MIIGTGIDLLEIERISQIDKRQPKLVNRVLTESEMAAVPVKEPRRTEYIASRYAVKEAASKAFGTGIGASLGFHDIEIRKDRLGKPCLDVTKEAVERCFPAEDPTRLRFHVSISHSKQFVVAQVIVERT
ncbi:holo-[acyl-carrier-protein] synthase [Brevibacillus fluminis]|uniref:Holo-[acyl-carrier-protein] synthase n=1 Tax=Brevibacillus fluminis TaxID=511487 RepID=A0A3M8DTQ4_9BACL|nr:holo-ACP synthase [Brevibacillus fluminis]RNB91486.1 holo-[acyl-carrier-protein] synthase [Brevibacillus fluminis]